MAHANTQPHEAQNIDELLRLLQSEKKRIRTPVYQPHLLSKMKANVVNLSDTMKHCIDKTALVVHQQIDGVDEVCPELSKYVSILTVSVQIINYSLCDVAANLLLKVAIDLFDAISNLCLYIKHEKRDVRQEHKQHDNDDNNDDNSAAASPAPQPQQPLMTLVGVIWQHLKQLKTVPLDNVTSVGRQIMSTLTVVRDAGKELRQSIRDMENNECIVRLDPWRYDYAKLTTQQKQHVQQQQQQPQQGDDDDDDTKQEHEDVDDDDDDDMLCFGMSAEEELNELQSLRVYQINECVSLADEVLHHIYLFVVKHLKENLLELDRQKQWLNALTTAIQSLPHFVDELSCCIYTPQTLETRAVCQHASNLLHFLWRIAIEVAEENVQYKTRKMVIKNKKKKSKMAVTGYEWKCKFVDCNLKLGEMFGLLDMRHIERFIENDSHYRQRNQGKKEKQKKRGGKNVRCHNKHKKRTTSNPSTSTGTSSRSNTEMCSASSSQKEIDMESISDTKQQNDDAIMQELMQDLKLHKNNEDIIDID